MTYSCPKAGCTVAATGICLLNVEPADACPVMRGEVSPAIDQLPEAGTAAIDPESVEMDDVDDDHDEDDYADPIPAPSQITDLPAPAIIMRALSPGRELGLDGLSTLARKRPVRLIGLLGAPDAGKTMALVSMFLLAAQGRLKRYEYRNSESAFAFDELSKGARAWSADGKMLEQLVPHTELADERRPGFLHLRLYSDRAEMPVDLAFPDLPGEWTDTLINKGVYDRLAFLANAEAIWVFVDGEKLADLNFGHDISARTCNLIGRLSQNLPVPVPLKLVVTRADQFQALPPAMIDPIKEEAIDKGFDMQVHPIVSVDKATQLRSGEGLSELLDATITISPLCAPADLEPSRVPRQILRYRSEFIA